MRLERFSPGRDKGIDLRCLTTGGAVGALRPRGLGEVENEYGFAAAPQLTMSAGADAINVLRRALHVHAAVEDNPAAVCAIARLQFVKSATIEFKVRDVIAKGGWLFSDPANYELIDNK